MNRIYTVGHSNVTLQEFYDLIQVAGINCIIDVRSVPASTYSSQFNKEPLSNFMKARNVYYLHFGEEFGARRSDSLVNGQVNFEEAVKTSGFLKGFERVKTGLDKGLYIALMCSEADPLTCHRFYMVSRFFHDNGYEVMHILPSKEIRSHEELEAEMIQDLLKKKRRRLPEVDNMFMTYSEDDQRQDAYRIMNEEIGYKPEEKIEIEH